MKWMIASDIHGSAKYCRQMLALFERVQADRLILLGDLLYHGPRNDLPEEYDPRKVAGMLNRFQDCTFSVRGNCEADVDQKMLDFPIMAPYAYLFDGKASLFLTHGDVYNKDHLPPLHGKDILVYGHVHVPLDVLSAGRRVLNPGSVGIPKENSAHSCIVLDEAGFHWMSLDGEEYHAHALDGE